MQRQQRLPFVLYEHMEVEVNRIVYIIFHNGESFQYILIPCLPIRIAQSAQKRTAILIDQSVTG